MSLHAGGSTLVVAVLCSMDALSVSLAVLPLPHIPLSLRVPPAAVSLHRSVGQLPQVALFSQLEHSLTVGAVVGEITSVG